MEDKYCKHMIDPEDDYDDWDDSDERQLEEDCGQFEEDCERAYTCKCGAWVFNSKGLPVHVADCYCGAE